MAIIGKKTFERLGDTIKNHINWFIWRVLGDEYVYANEIELIRQNTDLPISLDEGEIPTPTIKLSFTLGGFESVSTKEEWEKINWKDLLDRMDKVEYTPVEKIQIEAATGAAYSKYRNLGRDIENNLYSKLAQATQTAVTEAQVRDVIKDKVELGLQLSKTRRNVGLELRQELKETKRDWIRVAATEMHAARESGLVSAITEKKDVYRFSDGVESNVSVVPAPDACSDCKRLYSEPSGNPKIFKLSELLNNAGTNYTRPWRKNARPVVPPLHPNCYCYLQYMPEGFRWNEEGLMTMTKPEGTEKSIVEPDSGEQLEKAIDNVPHSMLNAATTTLPTHEYIFQIEDLNELEHLNKRLDRLQQIYVHTPAIYKRIGKLIDEVRIRHYKLWLASNANKKEETDGSAPTNK